MNTPLISIKNLAAGYGTNHVLKDISFEVFHGEIFMVVGESGCGKSTLLKNMIGLHRPMHGEIRFRNKNICDFFENDQLHEIQRFFGVSYQQNALFTSMNTLENVCFPLKELTDLSLDAVKKTAEMKLDLVGLGNCGQLYPSQLSGGMQKRAAIARAMVMEPEILFLDEPSAGLDPSSAAELDHLILILSRKLGITFIIVSHDLESIFEIADRMLLLDKETGKIETSGKPASLKAKGSKKVKDFLNRSINKNVRSR